MAITTLLQIKEKLGPYSKIVHEEFGYLDRREDDAIPVHEIHEKICKDKVNGKIPRDDKTNRLELDEEKSEIYKAIRETLNLYEYVASGVHQGVFDKDIVADLFRSNVIKTASVFSAYIDHINHEMNPRCNGSIWVNLKTLGAEFKNNYREGTKAGKRGPA